jgi:hypothetical protein
MELRSIIKTCAIAALLSCSLSVYALSEKVKCPSVDFIKANLPGALNQVTQLKQNRFDVRYDDLLFDEESQRHWYSDVIVYTTKESDFNEAYQLAKDSIASIVRPEKVYLEEHEAYCGYRDKNGADSHVELYLYETSELAKMKMRLRK